MGPENRSYRYQSTGPTEQKAADEYFARAVL